MPYNSISFTPFDVLPASDLNILAANDASFNDGTGIATNAITAAKLATSAITLGYAQITSSPSISNTTVQQVSGLTTTVTIPAGGRKIKITAFGRDILYSGGGGYAHWEIWDGTVGSGTKIGGSQPSAGSAAGSVPAFAMAIVTPSAGSKTYNVGWFTSANTVTLEASASEPAFILVEAI